MPKQLPEDLTARIEAEIALHEDGIGIDDLHKVLADIVSRAAGERADDHQQQGDVFRRCSGTKPSLRVRACVLFLNRYNFSMSDHLKSLQWVGSSKKDLLTMPEDVIDVFGFALHLAQIGKKHDQAKPLKGFGGASVLEVVEDRMGDTYRAVYTVKITEKVYVLHCFQKKSTKGIETPKHEMDLIRERLKAAHEHAKGA